MYVRDLAIKRGTNADPVSSLSGGNQQKVVLAKWLNSGADFLILDEPTRGVDVGARREIYGIVNALAAKGKGLLVISSEMAELIGMCDRIYVFSEGKVAGCLSGAEMTEKNIMRHAIRTAGAL
jgi:ABC-type sugar transport system ATPase subunit